MKSPRVFNVALCSTGLIEDPLNHDEISDLKLSYNCRSCFFTVFISKIVPHALQHEFEIDQRSSVVTELIARFNEACSLTTPDETIDHVDQRFDALWQEAEDLVESVAFEPILAITKERERQPFVTDRQARCPDTLLEYLFPTSFNLQILATEDNIWVAQRPDLPVTSRFVVEPRIEVSERLMNVRPGEVQVVQIYRAHVLKVLTKEGVFCCKLNNADSHNSFLREFKTLQYIHNSPLSEPMRVPKLRGLVSLDGGGVVGLLMELIETDHPDMVVCLQREHCTSATLKAKWKNQIGETIEQLHKLDLVWGDAKTANVLIDIHENAWLTDFGGGFTQGYIDEALYDTKEGDLQGVQNVVRDLS